MFRIRCLAASGFDRAIVAMRRENGGCETSDSGWIESEDEPGAMEYAFGPGDVSACERLIDTADKDFLKFICVWAHIEAPVQWWAIYAGYFIAQGDVVRKGDKLTRSVMTTYANLRNLLEASREIATNDQRNWETWTALRDKVETEMPEAWLLLAGLGA